MHTKGYKAGPSQQTIATKPKLLNATFAKTPSKIDVKNTTGGRNSVKGCGSVSG